MLSITLFITKVIKLSSETYLVEGAFYGAIFPEQFLPNLQKIFDDAQSDINCVLTDMLCSNSPSPPNSEFEKQEFKTYARLPAELLKKLFLLENEINEFLKTKENSE